MKKKTTLIILPFLLLAACSGAQKEESVATVNGAPILLKDFRKEFSRALRRDPSLSSTQEAVDHQLESLIERKLMIQEAVKKGLSEDERFLDTIKTFWEQTLIRELIDLKTKEWSDKLSVTDEEIRKHYERMCRKLTFRLSQAPDEKKAEEIKAVMLRGDGSASGDVIGPLLIENIQWDSPFYAAFDAEVGSVTVARTETGYAVVQVIRKETSPAPPFEAIRAQIKDTLLEQKKQRILEDWLHQMRSSARVNIDTNLLKKVTDERK